MQKIRIVERLKSKLFLLFKVFKNATVDMFDQDGVEHSGYIAFLCLLSFFPAVIFAVMIAGLVGESQLGTSAIQAFMENIPENMANALRPIIAEIISGPSQGIVSVAFIGIIWTASSAIEGLRTILNKAYHVSSPPIYVLRRLLSIFHFLVFVVAIMATVFAFVLFPIVWKSINEMLGLGDTINLEFLNNSYLILFGVLFAITSMAYYVIPNIKLRWKFILPGAFITVIGWLFSGKIFGYYLAHFSQFNVIYGSLGGIVVSLIFFYIMSMIFVWGAEFNYHFGTTFSKENVGGIFSDKIKNLMDKILH
jgi:membrane protein